MGKHAGTIRTRGIPHDVQAASNRRNDMNDRLVPVRTFDNRIDAEMAKDLLEAQGIPSYISGDDAGGIDPALQLTQGVRLIVQERDLARAGQTLDDEEVS
jgi:hypothetical protein